MHRQPFRPLLLLALAAASSALPSGCVVEELPCVPGTNECPCDFGDRCGEGLDCVDRTCVSPTCVPGTRGCGCDALGSCGGALECVASVCVDATQCPDGTSGCPCRAGDSCDAGFECDASVCIDAPCPSGTSGCPCRAGDLCDAGFECAAGTCTVVIPDGRFVGPGGRSCDVIAPPESLALDAFYTKYLHCNGIAIVAPDGVEDEALLVADETMAFLLNGDAAGLAEMESRDHYYVLRPRALSIEDLPEAWPTASFGAPASYSLSVRAGTSTADSILCDPREGGIDPYHHFLNIFANMYAEVGLQNSNPSVFAQLDTARSEAVGAGFWAGTGPIGNVGQYFSLLTLTWFEAGGRSYPGGGEDDGRVVTRAEFAGHDAVGYAIADAQFSPSFEVPGCIRRLRVTPYEDTSLPCEPTVMGRGPESYTQVRIGSQCWMAQNVRTTVQESDGSPILEVADDVWLDPSDPAFTELPAASIGEDGRHYNFAAAMDICPLGTHLPSFDDALELAFYLGPFLGPSGVSGQLASAGGEWGSPAFTASDAVLFQAFPSEALDNDGVRLENVFYMWTSTTDSAGTARVVQIKSSSIEYFIDPEDVNFAASVRCLSD